MKAYGFFHHEIFEDEEDGIKYVTVSVRKIYTCYYPYYERSIGSKRIEANNQKAIDSAINDLCNKILKTEEASHNDIRFMNWWQSYLY